MSAVPFSVNIHAAPTQAEVSPGFRSALTIRFAAGGGYPQITLFCGCEAFAADLQAAIAGVIEKHAMPAAQTEREAA